MLRLINSSWEIITIFEKQVLVKSRTVPSANRYQQLDALDRNINSNPHYFIITHIWCIFTPDTKIMARQSISFTDPNDDWLKSQVDNKEYSSKSELVNDLIRQARKQQRQIDWINSKLEKAENSGFTSDSREQILAKSKSQLNG